MDEIRLMIAPVTLGDGLHLFGDSGSEQKWHAEERSRLQERFRRVIVRAPINRLLA